MSLQEKVRGNWAMLNGEFHPIDSVSFNYEGPVVYEVVKMLDNVVIFFGDHYSRFENSCKKMGHKLEIGYDDMLLQLKQLAIKNNFTEGNIMLRVTANDTAQNSLWHFVPHHYPTVSEYKEGARTAILFAERTNPEIKILGLTARQKADEMLADNSLYEVLLADRNGELTEGSRSNLVLIKGDELYTAPSNRVLSGVTMNKVLDICKQKKISVNRDKCILADDLPKFDALFITSTAPGIMPISSVDKIKFDVNNSLMRSLMNSFEELMYNYIEEQKRY